jgi:16S rRNA (uracil1498-N3)-methyltransferase
LVERGRRAPVATFYSPELASAGGEIALGEAAAHHAGVRRLAEGDFVRITNGRGTVGFASVTRLTKREFVAVVETVHSADALPLLELLVPVADRDRMLWLAEKATELAVSIWQPVVFARSRSVSPRGEGDAFAAKLRARMIAALEQSGGAWLPEVRRETALDAALARVTASHRYVLDPAGGRLDASGVGEGVAIVLGPEGGLEPTEREHLRASGWSPVALAPTTLRFETAGIAAVAILRAATTTVHEEE